MSHGKEETIFEEYLATKNLKHSKQRDEILDMFLNTERHLTAEELYRLVKEKNQAIGFVTVYRTLKLICESGIGRELRFKDGPARYEHLYGHQHHDHLICTGCGQFIEVVDLEIERLQDKLFKTHGFTPEGHRMELYGICKKCGGGR
ncbi:MAG: Fur family transcriptional regulator [Endomicrobiales bacterium]